MNNLYIRFKNRDKLEKYINVFNIGLRCQPYNGILTFEQENFSHTSNIQYNIMLNAIDTYVIEDYREVNNGKN